MIAAYNFQSRWRGKLARRRKRMTIRADRVDGRIPKVGATFRGYVGMRTKNCELVVQGVVSAVKRIEMQLRGGDLDVTVDGRMLTPGEAFVLAQRDGFSGLADFCKWFFSKRTTFAGHIIEWRAEP